MLRVVEHPVAWALLMYELDDAREHLGDLIDQMATAGEIEEPDFAIHLGHVFAHLNRAWHGRDDASLGKEPDNDRAERSRFPDDLSPIG